MWALVPATDRLESTKTRHPDTAPEMSAYAETGHSQGSQSRPSMWCIEAGPMRRRPAVRSTVDVSAAVSHMAYKAMDFRRAFGPNRSRKGR